MNRPDPIGNAEQTNEKPATEFPRSLVTANPEAGFGIAVKLARLAVKTAQPDASVLKELRPQYASDPDSLIAASHVVAVHFQTIAEANDWWRSRDTRR